MVHERPYQTLLFTGILAPEFEFYKEIMAMLPIDSL